MREILVSKLFQELLGPRTGDIHEILEFENNPISEFTTGILSPVTADQSNTAMDNQANNMLQPDRANNISSVASGIAR